MTTHYFEDLAVGQRFESASYTITADEIREFALRFDPQPFHTDEEAAKHSFFRGLAASGWHTASITMRLLIDGGLPFASGLIGAGADIKWPTATRPGDTLTVFSEIAELRASTSQPDRGWVTVQSETRSATSVLQNAPHAYARVPAAWSARTARVIGVGQERVGPREAVDDGGVADEAGVG